MALNEMKNEIRDVIQGCKNFDDILEALSNHIITNYKPRSTKVPVIEKEATEEGQTFVKCSECEYEYPEGDITDGVCSNCSSSEVEPETTRASIAEMEDEELDWDEFEDTDE